MLCSHCGHFNDPAEQRCGRCGRRLKQKSRGGWSRFGLERKEPPVLPEPALKTEPKLPPPDPSWKQQLELKLENYRTRRAFFGEQAKLPAPAEAPIPDAARKGPSLVALSKGPASTVNGPGRGSLGDQAESRPPDPRWRRVEGAPASPKLPPLRRPGVSATEEAFAAPRRRPAPPRASSRASGNPSVAPISLRAMAGLLDLTLVLVALGVFVGVFRLLGGPVVADQDGVRALVFAFFSIIVFYWIFYVRYIGETAGMMWLGLRLVDFNGRPPTPGQLRARALGTVLSTAAVGLGFAWSFADEEQLTWHDRMSKTLVTREEPGGEPG